MQSRFTTFYHLEYSIEEMIPSCAAMNEKSPPEKMEFSKEKNISVEQGFNICLLFFNDLWPFVESKIAKLDEEEITVSELFFLDVCIGFECSAQWNEAVFRIASMSKKQQRKHGKLTEKEVFLSACEFSKIYDKIFDFNLKYTLNLLESMLSDPENHSLEWSLWRRAVNHSFKMTSFVDLDWSAEFPSDQ